MSKSKTTLLLDSDIIAFKFASVSQKDFKWGDEDDTNSRVVEDISEVIPLVEDYITDLKIKLQATDLIVCLSCPSSENFRYTVLPSYKHKRVNVEKPILLSVIKDWMRETYPTYERPTLEADDIMGILSTHPKLIPGKKIIVSEDKDMKTIPGWLFNPAKDNAPYLITEDIANFWHIYQTVKGDTTDGYSGCPGAGEKAIKDVVEKSLKYQPYDYEFKAGPRKGLTEVRWELVPSDSHWESVVSLFVKAGYTEEDALVQARVARICRHSDYDFINKEVILWTPSSTA